MNGYELSRAWFDFAFEKKEAKVQHTALYLWIVELNNRLGWKKEFGIPTLDTMEGLSIGNKGTYLTTLKDLQDWGFITIVKEAKNQYQACIISICHSKNDTAQATALDTALSQHSTQHCNGTSNSIDNSIGFSTAPIDKQLNNQTIKQEVVVVEQKNDDNDDPDFLKKNREEALRLKQQLDAEEEERKSSAKKKEEEVSTFIERKTWEYKNKNPDKYDDDFYESFIAYWTAENDVGKQRWQEGYFSINRAIGNWHTNEQKFKQRDEYKRNNSSTASQAVGTSQNLPFGGKYLVADPQKVVASFRARQEAQGIK